jgi:hypothetical protein
MLAMTCRVCGYVACGLKVCVQITRASGASGANEGSIVSRIEHLCAPCTKWISEVSWGS